MNLARWNVELPRPAWDGLCEAFARAENWKGLAQSWRRGEELLRENGISYNLLGRSKPEPPARGSLDPIPALMPEKE